MDIYLSRVPDLDKRKTLIMRSALRGCGSGDDGDGGGMGSWWDAAWDGLTYNLPHVSSGVYGSGAWGAMGPVTDPPVYPSPVVPKLNTDIAADSYGNLWDLNQLPSAVIDSINTTTQKAYQDSVKTWVDKLATGQVKAPSVSIGGFDIPWWVWAAVGVGGVLLIRQAK